MTSRKRNGEVVVSVEFVEVGIDPGVPSYTGTDEEEFYSWCRDEWKPSPPREEKFVPINFDEPELHFDLDEGTNQ